MSIRRGSVLARWGAWLLRIAPALGLFFLAPLTAEYLSGYDDSTGNVTALLGNLVVFAPLYGGAALLSRETARRARRGWPSILLLGAAFGVLQAGLIDHSLFNTSYRDISYWSSLTEPTYVPALGIGAYPTLVFVAGHTIWSIAVPIALLEGLTPARATTPWLRGWGLATTAVLFGLAAAFVVVWHLQTEQFLPRTPQLLGAAVVVAGLVAAAFVVGRNPGPKLQRRVPRPWLLGVFTWTMLSLPTLLELVFAIVEREALLAASGWPGAVLYAVVLAGLATAIGYWSRSERWSAAHRLAVAGGALLTNALLAFLIEPLGDVTVVAKLLHNLGFLLGSMALLALAGHLSGSKVERRRSKVV